MTEKKVIETQYGWYQKNNDKVNVDEIIGIVKTDGQTNSVQLKKEAQLSICEKRILELLKENEQLKQYKQSVSDVLRSWSQKNLTVKQLQVIIAIMEELNVISDDRND